MLGWTSESEYFERFKKFKNFVVDIIISTIQAKSNHFTPHCACAARGKHFIHWMVMYA